jgi:hypothetical protein
MRFLYFGLMMLLAGTSWAQSKTEKKYFGNSAPTTLDPGNTSRYYSPEINESSKAKTGSHIETREEYVARMKRTVKMIRKNEKLMQKPQFSNPMYFGHKRLPRKHKPEKMRFCKECGIRH